MKLEDITNLEKDLHSAGKKEWLATKEFILDVSNDSVENPLLIKTKELFFLPLFMVFILELKFRTKIKSEIF